MDELEERLVSAALGLLWGAVLGVLVVMFFNYSSISIRNSGYTFFEWKGTIIFCAMACAVTSFIFKASTGTAIGALMSWFWDGITNNHKNNYFYNSATWKKLLVFGFLALAIYWIVKD